MHVTYFDILSSNSERNIVGQSLTRITKENEMMSWEDDLGCQISAPASWFPDFGAFHGFQSFGVFKLE